MAKLIIISGGPGSGKTTLLKHIKQKGYKTFDEVPRAIIEREIEKKDPVLPWINLNMFAQMCFDQMMDQKMKASSWDISFFDRAIGDIYAYLKFGGERCPKSFINEIRRDYYEKVFLLKPEKDLYVRDQYRPHTYKEALQIHTLIELSYREMGFKIVNLEFSPCEVQFHCLLDNLL